MVCRECGRTVAPDDRFCTGCGTRLGEAATPTPADDPAADDDTPAGGGTSADVGPSPRDVEAVAEPAGAQPSDDGAPAGDTTELLETMQADEWGATDPVWAVTAATPAVAAPTSAAAAEPGVATSDLPSTEPITEVWMESVPDAEAAPATPYDFVDDEPVVTQAMPVSTAEMPLTVTAEPSPHRFRFGAVAFIAVITGLVTLGSLFVTIISVTSDRRLTIGDDAPFGFRTGTWIIDDLADNLSIAGLLVVVTMVVGGIAGAFGWRWGSGLAGGAGLALAGLAGLALGLAQIPIDAAEEFARIPPDEPFTLTITRDIGYWALLVAAALGVVLFFASINDVIGDRRSGLNPWIAALGALATVVAAVGPLIPENLAVFSDNWYIIEGPGEAPALLLAGRLLQLGLLVVTGVIGFLSVRRWGLGLAIGGALPIVWLTISTLFELTDAPVGPGFRNPGAVDMHVHGVTTIGVSAVAAMSVLAVIAAYDQSVRERP